MSLLKMNTALYGPVCYIPFPPMDQGTDTLEYFTDVLAAYTNKVEGRAQMRAIPRETLAYTYNMPYDRMVSMLNVTMAGIRQQWAIPLWFEAQRASIAVTQTVFNIDTTYHDIRANTLVLVFSVRGTWEFLQVASITDTTVTTTTGTTLFGPVFVMPVRVGWITGQVPFKPAGFKNSTKITYEIDDVRTGLTDAAPQYNGYDLYTVPYNIDDAGATSVTWQDDQVDYDVGNIARSTPWTKGQYGKQYGYFCQNVQENFKLKQFFYRRAGKFRPFYSPSFEVNFRKVAGVGAVTTTLNVYDDGYQSLLFANYKNVAIQLRDDSWLLRAITAVTPLAGGIHRLTFDTALNVDISAIRLVSFAGLNRLDTDRLEITLSTGGTSKASLQVIEMGQ